ncbi:MAG: SPOR domain-containing protein [Rhodanobacteraceae bacterium]
MFVRVLFLLLLALNIGAACWLIFAPRTAPHAPPPTDPGVPRLVLLSERDQGDEAASAELAAAPQSAADLSTDTCRSIGPFPSQADVRAAMSALLPVVRRVQFREQHTTESRGYWVYLPALKTREEALDIARSLSQKGVRDYYVVTAGDQQNTISLGLFHDRDNAERRRAEIVALGFSPQLIERTEDLPVYWVDFAIGRDQKVDWRKRVANAGHLTERTVACF